MQFHTRPSSPGQGYRWVCIGEVCKLGDEVLHEWRGPWRQVIRLTAVTDDDPPIRRRLPVLPKNTKGLLLALHAQLHGGPKVDADTFNILPQVIEVLETFGALP